MEKGPVGLFVRKDQEREITAEEVKSATEVIRSLAARAMKGEPRVVPPELYEAIDALNVRTYVEAILIDGKGHYALHRRPANEKYFGANRLHVLGGALIPDRKGISPVKAARKMAQAEMGAQDIEYVAGPIATYQWKLVSEHSTGWPNSQVYVMKVIGDLPERSDIVWFNNNTLPSQDEMITKESGKIHLDYLRVFQEWCKNPNQPCRDLNEKPLPPLEGI